MDSGPPWLDGNGHGTHVASTMCGHMYGIVACKYLCAVKVKVLDNTGSGLWSEVIAGIDFMAINYDNAKVTEPSLKCVANMSLGGGIFSTVHTAVNNAIQGGITFVVAAGSSLADACNFSPAAAEKAITVGAIDGNDTPTSFTNYGSCVDVYASGVSITLAYVDNTTTTKTISGTSMTSPHTCALAAAALQMGVADPEAHLKADASKKTIDCRSQGTAGVYMSAPIRTVVPHVGRPVLLLSSPQE
ncbi:hypothetical protein ACHAW5_002374 [Stephanodiscus triporus]|uniref:subtilisin n=1 Tax=Stephanodiscus triporus TaxID=2934178 RepID=A0ABD3PNY6_9STRA